MSLVIQDPLFGTAARVVGEEGRLRTAAETISIGSHEALEGKAYNVNTGTINLTSATESGLLYILNNGANDLVIDLFVFLLGVSNVSALESTLRVYRNPTTGTLLAGTPIATTALNRNYGSASNLDATVLLGVEGSSITASDGVNIQSLVVSPARVAMDVGSVVLPRSASMAMAYVPPTGNTSMNVQGAVQIYELTDGI